jgi:hypothetical protein
MLFVPLPFHIPNSDISRYQELKISRGQLYNLTLDELLIFQFNPEAMIVKASDEWVPVGMGVKGRDMAFVSEGKDKFELQLLFMADPGAPDVISRNVQESLTWRGTAAGSGKADFDNIVAMIDRWRKPQPQTGQPSRLMVAYGCGAWEGIIRERRIDYQARFATGSTRAGMLTLKFEEWTPITSAEGSPK